MGNDGEVTIAVPNGDHDKEICVSPKMLREATTAEAASDDQQRVVSFVLGAGGGVAIVIGCMTGGLIADHLSKPKSYAVAFAIGVVAVALMPFSPRTPVWYAA